VTLQSGARATGDDYASGALSTDAFIEAVNQIHAQVSTVIHGKPQAIGMALLTLLSRGHLLIEDVPGVGKTMLAKSVAASIGGTMHRIQFTPDLMPSDVTGSSVFNMGSRGFEFRPGPVFANVVLADEINRSSPKTQSALLECMAESQVSVDGATYALEDPFFVIATQNPIDMAGTYPLPEPQRDRFLARISIGYPDPSSESAMLIDQGDAAGASSVLAPIIDLAQLRRLMAYAASIHTAESIRSYAVALVQATRNHAAVQLGASPRATVHLYRAARTRAALAGRSYVVPDDVAALAEPVLAHRLILHPESAVAGTSESSVIESVLERVPVPEPVQP
jgi:MoxR-like ATPase